MGESHAPSSVFSSVSEILPPRVELGTLRNGLGSIQNLELLLKSIKVGQKGLFAAVAAVHADCASMIASARSLLDPLTRLGADSECAQRLTDVLSDSLTELEAVLAVAVRPGRLSVAQRLKLERDLSRAGHELGAALRLVGLMDRASRAPPAESTPASLVHAASAERSAHNGVGVFVVVPAACAGRGLGVHLDAAQLLVALGVALVMEGQPERTAQVTFAAPAGEGPVTSITLGRGRGDPVYIADLGVLAASLRCAQVASQSLGGRFEFSREAHRVCIYWPLS
jgi:hypothetical protein